MENCAKIAGYTCTEIQESSVKAAPIDNIINVNNQVGWSVRV